MVMQLMMLMQLWMDTRSEPAASSLSLSLFRTMESLERWDGVFGAGWDDTFSCSAFVFSGSMNI